VILLSPPSTLPPGSTVWAYLRDSGGQDQDRSINRQLEAIEDYCRQHGLQLVHVWKDEARSGTSTAGRDDFTRMINQSKEIESNPMGLLLWNYARFARDLDDSTYYKSLLRRNGLVIHSLTDPIPEGPYARFVETLIDISNEERSRQTSIDAKDGLRSIVAQGAVPGTPPRGFTREPITTINPRTGQERKNHRWVPDPKLIDKVRTAFEMRAAGSTLLEIHKETRLFGSINSYRTFFTNRLYIGTLEFGGEVFPNYCAPIVDMETWNAVQKRIEATSQKRFKEQHPRRANSIYLLSGLVKCAQCGSPMSGNSVTKKIGRNEAYLCTRAKRHAGCDAKRISRNRLEELVISTLTEYILIPEAMTATQEIALENQSLGELRRAEKKRSLQERLQVVSREIGNITRAIGAAGHSEALLEELRRKELDRTDIKNRLKPLEIPIEPVPDLTQPQIENASKRLIDKLKSRSLEERREVLRGIIHEVVAERDGPRLEAFITYYYPPPFDFAPEASLSMSLIPLGAQLYRQTFTYHAVHEKQARSK
jgi:site-specific DNA recombinase